MLASPRPPHRVPPSSSDDSRRGRRRRRSERARSCRHDAPPEPRRGPRGNRPVRRSRNIRKRQRVLRRGIGSPPRRAQRICGSLAIPCGESEAPDGVGLASRHGRPFRVMTEFFNVTFAYPTVVFTGLLALAFLYWVLVIIGALGI